MVFFPIEKGKNVVWPSDIKDSFPMLWIQELGYDYCQKITDCLRLAASESWIPHVTGSAGVQTFAYWYKLNLKIAIYSPNQTNHCNAVFPFSSYLQPTTFNHLKLLFYSNISFSARSLRKLSWKTLLLTF